MKSGDGRAESNFWAEITEQGTPLVEAIPGDPRHVRVTFLWRGDGDTRHVVLFSVLTIRADSGFAAEDLGPSLLSNLPGTGVWFRTFTLRSDARFTYYFSPNDPLVSAADRVTDEAWATLQADPFNPKALVLAHEDRDWVRSIVDLPHAPPVRWTEPQTRAPKGQTEVRTVFSQRLQSQRRFWVYTPPGYSTERQPYGLLLLFDGWTYVHMVPTTTIIENLLAEHRIEPWIVVMVDQIERSVELSCHEPFIAFIVDELVPWIRVRYHVTTDPERIGVGGSSRGGLGAVCTAWRHPEIFGNVLSHAGYFSWDPEEETAEHEAELEYEWMIRRIAEGPAVDVRFVMSVGLLEHDRDFPHSPTLLQANRHLRDVLRAGSYDLRYTEYPVGHEIYGTVLALPESLIQMAERDRAARR